MPEKSEKSNKGGKPNMFATETRLAPIIAKSNPDIEVAWYYPNTYEIGMSGLGYQLVWWLFEQHTNVLIRRGFTDTEEANIEQCQLLGFTVSWELDFINILKIMSDKGIAHTCSRPTRRAIDPNSLWRRASSHSQSRTIRRILRRHSTR
jgi:hypothetical protein